MSNTQLHNFSASVRLESVTTDILSIEHENDIIRLELEDQVVSVLYDRVGTSQQLTFSR